MIKKCSSVLFLLFTFLCYSQNQNNVWYFGHHAGLDFNSGSPMVLTDGQTDNLEGCASISDENGSLLFYTDGITVWNKEHAIMDDGFLGHDSSTQSALIVPVPGSATKYYLFTVAHQAQEDGFNYSVIDMALNNGLGGVLYSKNVQLLTPATEKLTAVKRTGSDSYWVMVHGVDNNNFYAYPVTAYGVGAPVVSSIGIVIQPGTTNVSSIGCLKFSADGTKLAAANYTQNIQLFDFDAATGQVSNAITLGAFFGTVGVEFSLSAEKLYVTVASSNGTFRLLQYNFSGPTIQGIQLYNTQLNGLGTLQMAPDGKIYVAQEYPIDFTGIHYVGAINNPEEAGAACNFNPLQIAMPIGYYGRYGLPNFVASSFLPAVDEPALMDFVIPKGISPNGDQHNDTFNLIGLDVKKLSIFNRHGLEVFSGTNYVNQWHGQDKNGGDLPAGTYYYYVQTADFTKTGWVYLNRED